MPLRIRAEEKALLMRAASLQHTGLTDFVIKHALRAAKTVIEEADHVQPSERDGLRVLDLLENPLPPNAKLLATARALPAGIGRGWQRRGWPLRAAHRFFLFFCSF
jgi:uncharacterized protein (DUF1778 family)